MARWMVMVVILSVAVNPAWTGEVPPHFGRTAAKEAAKTPPPPGAGRGQCAAPLRNGCEVQQSSCRLACPPTWSTNPGVPAFTPNDRAGCTNQCLNRYLACLRLYGCS